MPPLWLRLAVAGLLVGSLAAAHLAPRPRREASLRELGLITWLGLALAAAAAGALAAHRPDAGILLVAGSVELFAWATWRARHRPVDPPPEADDETEPWPQDPDAVDWERFERDFRSYAELRERAPS